MLQRRLNERFGPTTGARYRTYVAMRHGDPSMETARRRMAEDGVTKVILLPLQPHYSVSMAGSALSYWRGPRDRRRPDRARRRSTRPTPSWSARSTSGSTRASSGSRARCATASRSCSRPTARSAGTSSGSTTPTAATSRRRSGPSSTAGPTSARRRSRSCRRSAPGGPSAPASATPSPTWPTRAPRRVLVVPISFLSDRVDTAFDLDVTARAVAAEGGHLALRGHERPQLPPAADRRARRVRRDARRAGRARRRRRRWSTPTCSPTWSRRPSRPASRPARSATAPSPRGRGAPTGRRAVPLRRDTGEVSDHSSA